MTILSVQDTADQFEVRLTWEAAAPLLPGRQYHYKSEGGDALASVTSIKFRHEPATGAHLAARVLRQGEAGVANLSLTSPVAFSRFAEDPRRGCFGLFDETDQQVARGEIEFALHRAANVHWQWLDIDKSARAALKNQAPKCLWLTGLSGSGKSTIANLLEKRLYAAGRHTCTLDGDNVRHGLNRDLGFTDADRVENIRRVAEVAKLMVDAGLIVLVSFISPFRAERKLARSLFAEGEFIEVFVDTPLAECEKRDTKGLYAKARRGELKNFTGIDSDYEVPEAPEIHLLTSAMAPDACVESVFAHLA